ncbi:SDR family NAD(P)-dependent oxidoreductase [Rhodococcoides fascians]|uniref:SDR family NAD(P)-dependent oxidoreductase n=1 Tax=Rhodococcoides fascians TaxID=1828 RepID=UPI00068D4D86|nr:glucose 1-dehydrogenase [Rhodococcus fascians]
MGRLNDKVVIVTGGAAGIGEAAVRIFVAEGAKVAIADVQDDLGADLEKELGDRVVFLHTDTGQSDDVRELVDNTVDHFGRLDSMFNNAAVIRDGWRIADHPEDAYDLQMAINVKGPWLGMKYGIAQMLKNEKGGSIVNTASLAGLQGNSGHSAYGASKGAVISLTRHAAIEYAHENIRVNCVCPSGTLTPNVFSRRPGVPREEVEAQFANTNPMRRGIRAEDVAHGALWLLSDDAAMVNGVVLPIDGGRSASSYGGPTPDSRLH